MLFRLWPALLLIAAISGCDTPKGADLDEQKNPHFIEGKERTKARDVKGAIEAFQHALDANPNSALAHFELGMLYEKYDEQNEWRYVLALYHYYRAYELRPNAYPADNARLRMQACRQELAKAESLAPLYPSMQRELEKLREENSQLRRQLDFLQNQMLARTSSPSGNQPAGTAPERDRSPVAARAPDLSDNSRPARAIASENSAVAVGPSARKHTVRDRETFASIARTYRLPVQSLLTANPGVEPRRLRAGQTVNIPGS